MRRRILGAGLSSLLFALGCTEVTPRELLSLGDGLAVLLAVDGDGLIVDSSAGFLASSPPPRFGAFAGELVLAFASNEVLRGLHTAADLSAADRFRVRPGIEACGREGSLGRDQLSVPFPDGGRLVRMSDGAILTTKDLRSTLVLEMGLYPLGCDPIQGEFRPFTATPAPLIDGTRVFGAPRVRERDAEYFDFGVLPLGEDRVVASTGYSAYLFERGRAFVDDEAHRFDIEAAAVSSGFMDAGDDRPNAPDVRVHQGGPDESLAAILVHQARRGVRARSMILALEIGSRGFGAVRTATVTTRPFEDLMVDPASGLLVVLGERGEYLTSTYPYEGFEVRRIPMESNGISDIIPTRVAGRPHLFWVAGSSAVYVGDATVPDRLTRRDVGLLRVGEDISELASSPPGTLFSSDRGVLGFAPTLDAEFVQVAAELPSGSRCGGDGACSRRHAAAFEDLEAGPGFGTRFLILPSSCRQGFLFDPATECVSSFPNPPSLDPEVRVAQVFAEGPSFLVKTFAGELFELRPD